MPDGPLAAAGGTVGEALARAVRRASRRSRGYVLDDQGRLRKHVCIFADGERLKHDARSAVRIGPQAQALCHAGAVGRVSVKE